MKIIALIAGVAILIMIALRLGRSRNPPSSRTVASPPDDGHLRIRDLTFDHIRSGRNWKVSNPDELLLETLNLEDIHIEEADSFSKDDTIAYAAIFVTEGGLDRAVRDMKALIEGVMLKS